MIRPARPEDAPAVIRIYQESRAEAMPWLPDLHTMEEHLGWFGALLGGEAWVFEQDGVPVGYAAMKDGELHDLYVAPEAQRRGVGSALFEQRPGCVPRRLPLLGVPRQHPRAAVLRRARLRGRRFERRQQRGAAAGRAVRVAA